MTHPSPHTLLDEESGQVPILWTPIVNVHYITRQFIFYVVTSLNTWPDISAVHFFYFG